MGVGGGFGGIWPIMADVERWPEWLPTMTSVENLGVAPLAIGNQYKLVQPGFRPTLWSVVALEPLHFFAWEASWPGARALATHTLRPWNHESSEVVLEVYFSGPLSVLARALAGRRIKEYLALEVATLKRKVENLPWVEL